MVGNILYDKFGRPHDPATAPQQGFPHHGGSMLPPTQDVNPGAWPENPQPSPQPAESYDPNAGAGGDWGTPEPVQDQGAGADWGTPDPQPEPAPEQGGDWGAPDPQPQPEPEPEPDQGGDWGGGGEPDTSSPGNDW